ncbi:hypothetical protein CsSME_00008797 [Camellia sinensis var. sinensis]
MATTTTPLYFASSIPKQSYSTNPHTVSSLSSRISIAKRLSLSVRSPPQPAAAVVVAESASAVVEVEPKKTAATPSNSLPFRVRYGFDLHRLEPRYPLIIGGIDIPHDRGCEAYSDGDVLLHCVVDAILGALLGRSFDDTEPYVANNKQTGRVHAVPDNNLLKNLLQRKTRPVMLQRSKLWCERGH